MGTDSAKPTSRGAALAEDFSNRIGARSGSLTTRDRPTPDDIDDLRRRREEHAKRTQEAPKKSFDSYLAAQEKRGGGGGEEEKQPPSDDEEAAVSEADAGADKVTETEEVSTGNDSKGPQVQRPQLPPMAGSKGRIIRG